MDKNSITVIFDVDDGKIRKDIEVPLDITANELIIGLNNAYKLGMYTDDIYPCYLKSENPIALLKGNKTLREFGLHNATLIFFKNRRSSGDKAI